MRPKSAALVSEHSITPVRLTDQIVNIIKDQIFRGELHPGERLVEQKFAKQLNVGQNPVREALIELAHLGFVKRVPNKGTYVTRISRADAHRISKIREPLEVLALSLIIDRVKEEVLDFQAAERAVEGMENSVRTGDLPTFFEHDITFHDTLWRMADEEYLHPLLEQLVLPLFAFFVMLNVPREGLQQSVEIHRSLLSELKAGSLEGAREKLRQLMELSLWQQTELFQNIDEAQKKYT
jgi:DNA-binding GntR family transcriptional regulator